MIYHMIKLFWKKVIYIADVCAEFESSSSSLSGDSSIWT